MTKKSTSVLERPVQNKTKVCLHHWIIDPAEGPTSIGVCKLCGEKRTFLNIVEYVEPKSSLARFFEADNNSEFDTDEDDESEY